MRTSLLAVPLCLTLTAATGCEVVGADDPALEELEGATLTTRVAHAVVRSQSGGIEHEDTWDFNEAEPGELFIHAVLDDTSTIDYRWIDQDELSHVEIYQRLTGKPAPRPLIDAQARADARTDEEDEAEDTSGLENEAGGEARRTGSLTQAVSATDFQDDYCYDNGEYLYCWPSFYGSPYVQRKTWCMHTYVAAVNDTIDFRMRYKKYSTSSWSTLISGQALPGQVHHVYTAYWGYRRWRRWEVLDNGDNLVRYSVGGDD
ncbi:MAG TPA: hypothetical protein VIG06_31480 [Kofleriaceae bacterium]